MLGDQTQPDSHIFLGNKPASGPQFNCFYVRDLGGLDAEPQNRSRLMPAMMSASSWIHMKQAQLQITHHPENMRMTGDEKIRPVHE